MLAADDGGVIRWFVPDRQLRSFVLGVSVLFVVRLSVSSPNVNC